MVVKFEVRIILQRYEKKMTHRHFGQNKIGQGGKIGGRKKGL